MIAPLSHSKEFINSGLSCPYCYSATELIDSAELYRDGTSYGWAYICRPCKAWVGCHKGTENALGRLADAELRAKKQATHKVFDRLHTTNLIDRLHPQHKKSKGTRRSRAYLWLSLRMGVDYRDCHIGMFTPEQCEQAISIVNQAIAAATFK